MNDILLEDKLSNDYCSLGNRLQISEVLNNRLTHLTASSKHTKVNTKILTTKIFLLLLLLFLIPATAYASIQISEALLEKVKDAGLNQKQMEELDNELRAEDFSEEDIDNFNTLQKNRYGQTYGPDALEANLIEVISEEGLKGYVYREDMEYNPDFSSPEEALKWQKSRGEYSIIPVYKSDGKTVIGTFKIGGGSVIEDTN